MNTIIEQLPLPDPTLETSSTEDTPHKRLRHNSKIARLPKADRDFINDLLDDGFTYGQIVQELQELDPPLPYPISERNLSGWYATGYQEYLRHQERLEILTSRFDFALDLAQSYGPEKLQALTLQMAAIRICEFLTQTSLADPETDSSIYLRLLSALPRITKEALNVKKYQDRSVGIFSSFFSRKPASSTSEIDTATESDSSELSNLKSEIDTAATKAPNQPTEPSAPHQSHSNVAESLRAEILNLRAAMNRAAKKLADVQMTNSHASSSNATLHVPTPSATAPFEISNLKSEITTAAESFEISNLKSEIGTASRPSEKAENHHPKPAAEGYGKVQKPNSALEKPKQPEALTHVARTSSSAGSESSPPRVPAMPSVSVTATDESQLLPHLRPSGFGVPASAGLMHAIT